MSLSVSSWYENKPDGLTTGTHIKLKLTRVRVCCTDHDHGGANASSFPEAKAVVLLLGKHWHLIIGIIHIYDHLWKRTFEAVNQLLTLTFKK